MTKGKLPYGLTRRLDGRRNPHPTGGVMWDWLRRSRMGMAEGRFIAINIKTCLQQRRERGDVGGDPVR